jgi:hypothetical protein
MRGEMRTYDFDGRRIGTVRGATASVASVGATLVAVDDDPDPFRSRWRLFTPRGDLTAELVPLSHSRAFALSADGIVADDGNYWLTSPDAILAAARRAGVRTLAPDEVPALAALLGATAPTPAPPDVEDAESPDALPYAAAEAAVVEAGARGAAAAIEPFLPTRPGTNVDDWLRAFEHRTNGGPPALAALADRHPGNVGLTFKAAIAPASGDDVVRLRALLERETGAATLERATWAHFLGVALASTGDAAAAAAQYEAAARDFVRAAAEAPGYVAPLASALVVHERRLTILAKSTADPARFVDDAVGAAAAAAEIVRRGDFSWKDRERTWKDRADVLRKLSAGHSVSTAKDHLLLGRFHYDIERYADATRSMETAIADAALRADTTAGNLYDAACYASLAAATAGDEAPAFLAKALAWIEEDVALRSAEARALESALEKDLSRAEESDLRTRLARVRRHLRWALEGDTDLDLLRKDPSWKPLESRIRLLLRG